nr:uncharacterized protein LOC112546646 [Pelodiscus sinensis]|eukprot:XP_025043135.1 uncharacterized protein LOC112546646 [Pelodiscus sinensis]
MDLKLPHGRRWPHIAMLKFLQHLIPPAYLLQLYMDIELLLVSFCMAVAAPVWLLYPTIPRRLETSLDWWDQWVMERWDDQQWLHNFRMHKATFLELCAWLSPTLQRRDTHLRPTIPVQKHVAIAFWKLATPDSYPSVDNQFGRGNPLSEPCLCKSSGPSIHCCCARPGGNHGQICCPGVPQLGWFLGDHLGHQFTAAVQDLEATMGRFAARGFPNCEGAINGMHIPIHAPEHQLYTGHLNPSKDPFNAHLNRARMQVE